MGENLEDPDTNIFAIKVQALRVDWIINTPQGHIFLNALKKC